MTDDGRYDDDYYDNDEPEDEFEEALLSCGRFYEEGEGWYCSKAGSEECDWSCPFSR